MSKCNHTYSEMLNPEMPFLLDTYIQMLDGIARITNDCVYLIDFKKGEIPYISFNPLFLCGLEPTKIKELGFRFNQEFISEADHKLQIELTSSWFQFLTSLPVAERCKYTLDYNYFLQDKLVNATMTPILLDDDGRPQYVLCNTKISVHDCSGNGRIFKMNSHKFWRYSSEGKRWIEDELVVLNDIEQNLLRLAIQGKNETEISNLLFRSKDGIKSIKQRIFKKLEVANITEAVSFAISHGLI
ncbi:MAG: response regulator transcription factor [Marinifilaceae bacterium]